MSETIHNQTTCGDDEANLRTIIFRGAYWFDLSVSEAADHVWISGNRVGSERLESLLAALGYGDNIAGGIKRYDTGSRTVVIEFYLADIAEILAS